MPVIISVAVPFFSSIFGVNIRDYYTDDEVSLDVQLRGARWCFEELWDDRTGYGLYLDLGPTQEAIIFGGELSPPALGFRGTTKMLLAAVSLPHLGHKAGQPRLATGVNESVIVNAEEGDIAMSPAERV